MRFQCKNGISGILWVFENVLETQLNQAIKLTKPNNTINWVCNYGFVSKDQVLNDQALMGMKQGWRLGPRPALNLVELNLRESPSIQILKEKNVEMTTKTKITTSESNTFGLSANI
jgi:hypothetical protein